MLNDECWRRWSQIDVNHQQSSINNQNTKSMSILPWHFADLWLVSQESQVNIHQSQLLRGSKVQVDGFAEATSWQMASTSISWTVGWNPGAGGGGVAIGIGYRYHRGLMVVDHDNSLIFEFDNWLKLKLRWGIGWSQLDDESKWGVVVGDYNLVGSGYKCVHSP